MHHDEIIDPNGNLGIYGSVHFKNYAIGVLPIDREQYTWLVGQYRYVLNEYSWEIPMGGGPLQDDILQSAKRELKEETGIQAGKWTLLSKIHMSNCVCDEIGYAFLAEDLSFGNPDFDESEKLEIWKLPFEDALDMVMKGEITDSLSVATILKYSVKCR